MTVIRYGHDVYAERGALMAGSGKWKRILTVCVLLGVLLGKSAADSCVAEIKAESAATPSAGESDTRESTHEAYAINETRWEILKTDAAKAAA